ncbi:hypothetical protein U1Q18_034990 [Sarracenia purpurea var. burkii]
MDSSISEVAYEIAPFIRVFKDGRVERLWGTEICPPAILDPETSVQSKDVLVVADTGVAARLYKPKTTTPGQKLPLIVYIHGGAFFIQTAFSPIYQRFLNLLVAESNAVVVSVNYRRAPEHPLPTAHDDSWAAVKWVVSHSGGNGEEEWLRDLADFDRVFFLGDSAGGSIAHNMGIRVGLEGLDVGTVAGIILVHPNFWGKDPIGGEVTDMGVRAHIEKIWAVACPTSSGVDDPLINPVKDPKLSSLGCTKVLVIVAERDVFRRRGWFYYEALGKSGWGGKVEIMETEGEDHIFHLKNPNSEKVIEMVKGIVYFMKQDKLYS